MSSIHNYDIIKQITKESTVRYLLLTLIAVSVIFTSGCFQKDEKVFTVGILQYRNTNDKTREGFINGLTSLDYINGRNTRFVYPGNASDFEDIEKKLDHILRQKPDIIYAMTTPATRSAYLKAKKLNIPVVFGPINDPVKSGIIKSLSRPGENITGVKLSPSDPKRLEWMKVIKKDLVHVLVPYNPNDKSSLISVSSIESASVDLNVTIHKHPVRNKDEIIKLIENLPEVTQAIFMPRDGLVMSSVKELAEVCLRNKIILSTPRYEQMQLGATMGYGFVGYEVGIQTSRMAASIMKGNSAGDIPVETAEDYLFINRMIAEEIGLAIDSQLLNKTYK